MASQKFLHEMLKYFADNNISFKWEHDFQREIERYLVSIGYNVERERETCIDNKKVRLDFLIRCSNISSVLEVKYKLYQKHTKIENSVYAFFKDISRIECILDKNSDIENGFCIFLSNDQRFWVEKQRNNPSADAREFKLNDGCFIEGTKTWHSHKNNLNLEKNYPPIKIRGRYKIVWHDYGHIFIDKQSETDFKYVLLAITRA
ncbi:hypothetical protein [Desulfovibrio sp. ZJ369]|uniref:hypothetical protein n=1 Tax=Desulfovibrio sp. ZJ369 TaxID=2709793 RepID=UPI0013EC7FD5|nr:hypothetical protein [Desulfovibrio sp. ZJ369]